VRSEQRRNVPLWLAGSRCAWTAGIPATANGLTNGGGATTEVHSPDETPKLSYTEFSRRTIVFVHLIVTLARLARPGGLRSVVAESVLVRHQLLILNRGRKRAPNLRATDRIIAGLCTLFMRPARVLRSAIVVKPSTLLHLHGVLCKRKYRMLFSSRHRRQPGPKGPNKDLIEAVVAMKQRNPGWAVP
jgi:hypothetical protein